MTDLIGYSWAGLVIGVSFLATPVKFRAESLTRPVALDVGRATFHALGKIEWLLALALTIVMLGNIGEAGSTDWALLAGVLTILTIQAFWLVPLLDIRVAAIIDGATLPKSHAHTVFAVLEAVKVALLFAIGTRAIGGW